MTFDPFQEEADVGVRAGHVFQPAVQSPTHQAGEDKGTVRSRADERRTAVVGAAVESFLAARANEAFVQSEAPPELAVAELTLAGRVADDRNLHELQLVGGGRALRGLAPARHRAVLSALEDVLLVGQAQRCHVDLRLERSLPFHHRDVVVQAARVILRMCDDLRHFPVVVRGELERAVAIPLAGPYEVIRWDNVGAFQAVICCECRGWVD